MNDMMEDRGGVRPLTFRDLMWPHITSPSPYDDLSKRYSKIASLLYSFPSAHETTGSCNTRYGG